MARVKKIKGTTAEAKKKAIHKMVESLIKGDSTEAADHLHDYLQMKSKEIIIGEAEDEKEMVADSQNEDESDDEDEDDDEKDDDEDEDEDDDKVEEGFAQPSEGAMSKKTGKFPEGGKKKGGIEKHGNSSAHLDDKIKGKAKYKRFPKGKPAETHANVKDDYDAKCDGRDKDLGTTE